jgi:hypothetical protein
MNQFRGKITVSRTKLKREWWQGRVDPLLNCMKCQGGSRCKAAPTRRRGARPEIYNSVVDVV